MESIIASGCWELIRVSDNNMFFYLLFFFYGRMYALTTENISWLAEIIIIHSWWVPWGRGLLLVKI